MRHCEISTEDIHKFLSNHGLKWSGRIYDTNLNNYRVATDKDFFKNNNINLMEFEHEDIFMQINQYMCKTYSEMQQCENNLDEDLTDAWFRFLLRKYGLDYARMLNGYCCDCCTVIEKQAFKQIEQSHEHNREIRERARIKMRPYKLIQRDLVVIYGDRLDPTFTNFS